MLEIKFAVEAETVGRCEAHGLTENVSPTVGFEYRFATSSKLSKLELHGHSKTIHLLSHSARWEPDSEGAPYNRTEQGCKEGPLCATFLPAAATRTMDPAQYFAVFSSDEDDVPEPLVLRTPVSRDVSPHHRGRSGSGRRRLTFEVWAVLGPGNVWIGIPSPRGFPYL